MAASSITHDFVVKSKEEAEKLAKALSKPKAQLSAPVKQVTGKENIMHLLCRDGALDNVSFGSK